MTAPSFPPLFQGEATEAEPMARATAQAVIGCDSGLVVHRIQRHRLEAAVVLAPEMPLAQAVSALIACGLGFQNALGALAPPEVPVHLGWTGQIRINGAACGRLRITASSPDPEGEPDWLIIGLDLPLTAPTTAPGQDPNQTYLYEEGCAEVDPTTLLEAWIRHSLIWLSRMEQEGNRPLADAWRGLAHGLGEEITQNGKTGTFLGTDEAFGMLLRTGETTDLIPLTTLLETQP